MAKLSHLATLQKSNRPARTKPLIRRYASLLFNLLVSTKSFLPVRLFSPDQLEAPLKFPALCNGSLASPLVCMETALIAGG